MGFLFAWNQDKCVFFIGEETGFHPEQVLLYKFYNCMQYVEHQGTANCNYRNLNTQLILEIGATGTVLKISKQINQKKLNQPVIYS